MAPKNDPRTIFGWAMYDWANSAYATTTGAIVAAFFTREIVPPEGFLGMSAEALWAFLVSVGTFILFLAMPVLGAVADYSAAKRRFLRGFALFGAAVTLLMPFVPAGGVVPFLLLFLLTQIGFVAGNVFYDGFLPEISTDDTIDRVSSKGFAFGYIGGGLYLLVALGVILASGDGGILPIGQDTAVRAAIFGAGLWWAGFSLVALARLPETGQAGASPDGGRISRLVAYARIGFGRTFGTTVRLVRFPQLLLFVVAFLLYNDGVQTVINISGAYADQTLELDATTIIIGFLVVQFIAFGGSLGFGALAVRIGTKQAILVSLAMWVGIAVGAYFLPAGASTGFYLLAAAVGFVLGGTQALSRSLYGSMIPEEASAEFYGFFSVFSKFSAIWGPLLFGWVSLRTGSGRSAILSIVVFFVLGGVVLAFLDVDAARASRSRWRFEGAEAETIE